jgi:hypothetical protein
MSSYQPDQEKSSSGAGNEKSCRIVSLVCRHIAKKQTRRNKSSRWTHCQKTDEEKQELEVDADYYGLQGLIYALRMPKLCLSDHFSLDVLRQREQESQWRGRAAFSSSRQQADSGLLDPFHGLIPVFCPEDGIAAPLKYIPESSARRSQQDMLFLEDVCKKRTTTTLTDDPRTCPPPVCVASVEAFRTNFNREWPNVLQRIEQILLDAPVIIAGGAVLRALTSSEQVRTGGDLWGAIKTRSDIDRFLYTSNAEEANRISRRIFLCSFG